MTTVSGVPKRGRRRRRLVLAVALLAVLAGGAGIAYRLWKRPEPARVPPDVPAGETEEAVIVTVRTARQRVPGSARAWARRTRRKRSWAGSPGKTRTTPAPASTWGWWPSSTTAGRRMPTTFAAV